MIDYKVEIEIINNLLSSAHYSNTQCTQSAVCLTSEENETVEALRPSMW